MDNKCVKEGFARLTIVLCVVVFGFASAALANELQENETPQQSRTGPKPPREVLEHDALKPQVRYIDILSQATLTVPAYNWRHGCGPTAVGMVVGYYDTLGYSDLVPGSAASQTSAVNQAIASGGDSASPYPPGSERHYEDYARPEDSKPNLLTDDYLTQGRTAHNNDCIADYMDTSKSTRSNYYGWSWSSDVGPAFVNYVNRQNTAYGPSFQEYRTASGTLTWSVLTGEIDAGRPMVFLVDTDGNNETDHFVTVIGYRTSPANQYGCWDTWSTSNIRWENFAAMSNGVPWGIWGGWRLKLAPPTGSLQVTINPQGVIDAGAQWRRVGNPTWRDSGYTESGIPVGEYTITFKDVSGWTKPANKSVTIYGGQTTNESGTYTPILYGGGSGTEDDPYQIGIASHWQNLMNASADWDKYFILRGDIDLNGVALSPVGNESKYFTGVFDGNGYVIRNADVSSEDSVGLFGYVGLNGHIRNLCVEDVAIKGRDRVGGMVGYNSGSLTDCCATGDVSSEGFYVGGLVGQHTFGTITNCYSAVTVSNDVGYMGGVGGLVGLNYEGTITNCYSTGNVSGSWNAGGLVGHNWDGSVTDCYATGLVGGSANNFGGLVGINSGSITACYATGDVNGSMGGGLVGLNWGSITDCYATGSLIRQIHIGGLVGKNGNDYSNYTGWIYRCYSTGKVTGTYEVGGLVGYNELGEIEDSFWDVENSGQSISDGGTPKTTAEMKTLSTFTDAGWDFVNIWDICEGTNYPRFGWQILPSADWVCPDGVGFEDFGYLADGWQIEFGINDLMSLCEQWLTGR